MPNPASVLSLAVKMQADPASLSQLGADVEKSLTTHVAKSSKQIGKMMSKSLAAGSDPAKILNARAMHRRLMGIVEKAWGSGILSGWQKVRKKLAQEQERLALARAKHEEALEERNKTRRKSALREIHDFRMKQTDEQVDAMSKGMAGAAGTFVSSLKGADLEGIAGLGRGAGRGIRTGGEAMQAKGMKRLGPVVAKLGGAVAAIAALAGGIALAFKVFTEIEGVAKDFNKTLLEGSGTVNNLVLSTEQLRKGTVDVEAEMSDIREIFTDPSVSRNFFTEPKQIQETVSALNETGFTIRRITGHLEDADMRMKALRDSTELALTYAALLGKTNAEMAKDMGKMAFEQGTTLERIAEGLSAVHETAQVSGFEVKRFYAAVLEATTGMGMYNVRIEKAAGLLKTLSTVLGETVAGEFLKSMKASMEELDIAGRIREREVAGRGYTRRLLTEDARQEAAEIARDVEAMGDRGELVKGILGDLSDPDKFANRLANMSESAFGKVEADLLAVMGAAGTEFVNQVRRARELARGGRGKEDALAVGAMDPTSALLMKMRQVERVLKKPITAEMSDGQLAALQSALKLAPKQIRQLRTLLRTANGQYARLVEMAEGERPINEELLKQTNTIIENGKVLNAVTKEEVKSGKDILAASEDFVELSKEVGVSEDIKLAQQISRATNATANVLKTSLLGLVEDIYDVLVDWWKWLRAVWPFEGESEAERAERNRMEATTALKSGIDKAEQQQAELGLRMAKLQDALAEAVTEEQKAAIKEEIEQTKRQQKFLDNFVSANEQALDNVATVKWESGMTGREVMRRALGEETRVTFGETAGGERTLGGVGRAFGFAVQHAEEQQAPYTEAFQTRAAGNIAKALEEEYGADVARQAMSAATTAARGVIEAERKAGREPDEEAFEAAGNRAAQVLENVLQEHLTQQGRGAGGGVSDLQRALRQVDDFILTREGQILQTNPQDTIIGFQNRGGRGIAGGMAAVQVNIYGGDKREVYSTVREAIRASQKATA